MGGDTGGGGRWGWASGRHGLSLTPRREASREGKGAGFLAELKSCGFDLETH